MRLRIGLVLLILSLVAVAALPNIAAAQPSVQITQPQAGAEVTSPVLVSGATSEPTDSLNFSVRGALSGDLGSGSFPVKSPADPPFDFSARISFNTPRPGEALFISVWADGGPTATVAVVAPGAPPPPAPQQIIITSPPSGTTVGSPVTITGTTARMPASGGLTFAVTNAQGATISQGGIPVAASGSGGAFVASISFPIPPQGGIVRVTLTDINPATGAVDASSSIDLFTQGTVPTAVPPPPPPTGPTPAPPQEPQQIVIESPLPGASVTSPMTLSGYSIVFPINGTLNYTLATQQGVALASGTFEVQTTGQRVQFVPFTFNTQIAFSAAAGTPMVLTVFDQNPDTGAIPMSVGVNLVVAGGAPSGSIVGLTIDSPPANANVTLPGAVVGRTDLYPNGGNLNFRVLNGAGQTLVDGTIPVRASYLQPVAWNANFNYSTFTGPVVFQVWALNPTTGEVMASVSRVYFVGGQ
ncbi:MAG: Gmad2 immunoglobulin-like domain-containing protein [Anaerolineae bacterium]